MKASTSLVFTCALENTNKKERERKVRRKRESKRERDLYELYPRSMSHVALPCHWLKIFTSLHTLTQHTTTPHTTLTQHTTNTTLTCAQHLHIKHSHSTPYASDWL